MLQCFELVVLDIWNPSGIFMYRSLCKNSCKYGVTTSMRCKSSHSKTTKQIRYVNMVMYIIGGYISS